MVPSAGPCRRKWWRFPRTRGDGPQLVVNGGGGPAVPPHPRGWSLAEGHQHLHLSGSPAPAGMVPYRTQPRQRCPRFPRTRGDGPSCSARIVVSLMVPPHPRGWSLAMQLRGASQSGSPAPAGMVPPWAAAPRAWRGFPRTRGDGPPWQAGSLPMHWVPPHPRGWSLRPRWSTGCGSGSPAPAGMVPTLRSGRSSACRFPRTRGDGPFGSGGGPRRERFPRTRGDGPSRLKGIIAETRVPPHPRGWSRDAATRDLDTEGSPAPAGMVPSRRRRRLC